MKLENYTGCLQNKLLQIFISNFYAIVEVSRKIVQTGVILFQGVNIIIFMFFI